jgi:4'-phosphopantetheinyl transferase
MDDDGILWPTPPAHTALDSENVHVWAVSLQVPDDTLIRMAKMLAPAERRRAESFHFARDRNRFVAGRGTLRTILGHYLRAAPASVALTMGSHGKPFLAASFARSGLHFNLAHCEDLALLAVTRGRVVGIDLERIRALDGAEEMAACFCSPRENAEFLSLPPGEKDSAFFRLWTRKEAWLKATGKGIGKSLETVEVSFRAGQTACFVDLPEETGAPARAWSLRELTPALGFIAALALPGDATGVSCWQWKIQMEEFEYAQN